MKKILLTLIALCCLCGLQTAFAQGKQKISVLYVGGSADTETMGVFEPLDSVVLQKSIQSRMASFSKFLKSRFKTVKVVNGKDYTADMSAGFDITVFDGRPKELRPRVVEYGPDGNVTKYESPAYLPDDFNYPALFIASASRDLGGPLGNKNDWYCLCLNDHAHSWVKDHPIFQGPWKVDLNVEVRPTPAAAFEYAMGEPLPKELDMWRVQTAPDRKYRIGMVSRPGGYLDSPETEIISSGECGKSIDAIAIGRHGNFFHWGFSASPKYLTKAGQTVLANAIVYAAKACKQQVIARKLNESIATRDDAKQMKYMATRKAWEKSNNTQKGFYQMLDSIKQAGLAKRAKGEELDDTEKMYVDMPIPAFKPVSYADYLKKYFDKLFHVFGEDAAEYQRYYDKNVKWFRPDERGYYLDIDEDVRSIGIANNDKKLLERCISMLEKGEEVELATRVLHRYTLCRFAVPAEWRNWYNTYQDKMFFTEAGGWLFLINTTDKNVPGNDYSILKAEEAAKELPKLSTETDEQNPVQLSAAVQNGEVVIRMKIHQGFHTYANVSESDSFVKTEVKIELPEGWQKVGDLQLPVPQRLNDSKTTAYKGDNVFRQKISGSGKGTIKCTVIYQCCNADTCLIPEEKELTVDIQ